MNTELHHDYPMVDGVLSNSSYECEFEEQSIDERAGLSSTEMVQQKLLGLLPTAPVPVSILHIRRDTRR